MKALGVELEARAATGKEFVADCRPLTPCRLFVSFLLCVCVPVCVCVCCVRACGLCATRPERPQWRARPSTEAPRAPASTAAPRLGVER